MRPNVLQLVDSFNQGGTERQVVQLTRLLLESGNYNVHLACLSSQGVLRAEMERMGFSDIPEFPLKSFYDRNALLQLKRFSRFLKEKEIDIVHAHDFYTNIFGMFGAGFARVKGRIASRRETDGIRSKLQRWTERGAYSLAGGIIANAEAVKDQLIAEGVPAEKIHTIYNGMDTGRVMPRAALSRDEILAKFNLPREARFVSIVANMRHAMKDQATFLQAARIVSSEVKDAAFVLAGEGELLKTYKELARTLNIQTKTFFPGRVGEVSDLLSVSDVCVLSSSGVEGFSNSILEYMAAARPVVATRIGGAPEAVEHGETGYIVDVKDYKQMATHIIDLLKSPERAKEMGERGLLTVKQKFSLEAQLRNTEDLYRSLLKRPKEALSNVGDVLENS
jgi:L-malate glycosyltransferase